MFDRTAHVEALRDPPPTVRPRAQHGHELLTQAAAAAPDAAAIDFLGRVTTYRALAASVERVAAGLQAIGVVKGDRVGLCLPNTPYSVIGYYAALAAGAVVVNFNPLYVERELEHQIRDSGTSVMLVIDVAEIHEKVAAACTRTSVRRIVSCPLADALPWAKGALYRVLKRKTIAALPHDAVHVPFASLASASRPLAPVALSGDDVAVLQYTGGTTGTPKGAMLTHANIIANTEQNAAFDPTRRIGEERVLGVLPLFHVFAMTVVMNYAVRMAATMVLLPRFDLDTTLKTMTRAKPTVFPGVPTLYAAIAKRAQAKRADLSSVRLCISGGAPLPQEIARLFEAVTGAKLVEGYGLTEACPVVSCNPAHGAVKNGSIGLPLVDTIVEIRDPTTRALVPLGEKGELVIRGPQVMRGYWQQPAETARVLDQYGLRTGDIGFKDEDGYIFVVDRIKDIIICGGFNVYPRTIEDALYQHPDVAEAIALGVPDPYRGQAPKAFVVLRAGANATPATLAAFLEGYLSKIERPREIAIRASLPKTAVGKLSRKDLLAQETGGNA